MARPNSGETARRLIALLGHLTPGLSVPVEDLARTLDSTPEQLAQDLTTLSLCGVAPYGPDQMIDVFVEDGIVEVYSPLPAVTAPVRLSPDEAKALATALAAAGFTAEDPLAAKLLDAAAAGFDAGALELTLRSAIATHDSSVFETLATAVSAHHVITIEYQSGGTERPTAREVEPQHLFAERGAWYLSAWCRTAQGSRTFRIDRIRSAAATGERFESIVTPGGDLPAAFTGEGLPVATLRFSAGEPFIEREWPGGRVTSCEENGTTMAEVPYAGTSWIARRVVARLGTVEAVAPAEVRSAVRALAESLLAE